MICRIQPLLIIYVGICLCLPTPQDNDSLADLVDILDLPGELIPSSWDSDDILTDRELRKLARIQAREERKQDREEKMAAIQQQKEERKQDKKDMQLASQEQKELERNTKEKEEQQEKAKQDLKIAAQDQKQEQKLTKQEQKKSSSPSVASPPSKDPTFLPSPAAVPAESAASTTTTPLPEDQVLFPAISDQQSIPSTSIAARIKAATNGDLSKSSSSSMANTHTDSVNHDQPFRFLHPSSSSSSSGLIMDADQNGNTDLAGRSSVLAHAETSQFQPSSGSSEQPIAQGHDPLSNPSQSPDTQTPKIASSTGLLAAAVSTIACVAVFGIGYISYSAYCKFKIRCLDHNFQDENDTIENSSSMNKPVSKTIDQVSIQLTAEAISQATQELLFLDDQVVEKKRLTLNLTLETSYSGSEEERKKVMEIVRLSKMPSPILSESLSRHSPY